MTAWEWVYYLFQHKYLPQLFIPLIAIAGIYYHFHQYYFKYIIQIIRDGGSQGMGD